MHLKTLCRFIFIYKLIGYVIHYGKRSFITTLIRFSNERYWSLSPVVFSFVVSLFSTFCVFECVFSSILVIQLGCRDTSTCLSKGPLTAPNFSTTSLLYPILTGGNRLQFRDCFHSGRSTLLHLFFSGLCFFLHLFYYPLRLLTFYSPWQPSTEDFRLCFLNIILNLPSLISLGF